MFFWRGEKEEKMVGASGFEPPASCSRSRRASQAALRPDTGTASQINMLAHRGNLRLTHELGPGQQAEKPTAGEPVAPLRSVEVISSTD